MSRFAALWFLPPVLAGAATAAWFAANAAGPGRLDTAQPGLAVRVVEVGEQALRPVARGWGSIYAAQTWSAVAEVRGQVIWRHPELESGRLIEAGTRVLEIDPEDYRLAIAQAEADLAALAAEAAQIDAEEANTARVLALEEARLALSEADLARLRELVAQGAAPQSRADEAERGALLARRTVVELQNALALMPSRRERVAAQLARTEAALARARRDLAHTVVTAPIDLRVSAVHVERFQYVNVGQALVAGDGIGQVEVVAQVPVASFQRMLGGIEGLDDIRTAMQAGPQDRFEAELRLVGQPEQVWPGRVSRVEGAVHPRARTVQVVISVDDPYAGFNPPLTLPLVPNMQVEITLTGPVLAPQVVIPEGALRGSVVHVLAPGDRLELRPVVTAFRQDGLAAIAEGLEPGESIVVDDIAPALPGMRLNPVASGQ